MYPILLSNLRSTCYKVRHMSWVTTTMQHRDWFSCSRKMRAVVWVVQRRPECWRATDSEKNMIRKYNVFRSIVLVQ